MTNAAPQDSYPLSQFLRMAVVTGVESAVQVHINRGDDLNARDAKGQTPLMLSAARNKAAICKLLLASGADADLLDPSGRNALGIARTAGANEAAKAIEMACTSPVPIPADPTISSRPTQNSSDAALAHPATDLPEVIFAPVNQPPALEPAPVDVPTFELDTTDDDSFDLAGWETEEDPQPPEVDETLSVAAIEIQNSITEHWPIDTSTDWDDFEAFLPDQATPLPRADDAEARETLRLILLRAIREGSVPQSAVDDLTLSNDSEPDSEAAALLGMVINDLAAETDERLEYSAPHESFEVFVAPEEKPDEEDLLAEALAFLDDLANRRNDPFRIYQREFQGEALLTAEAEIKLGQAMEHALEKALDFLAAWPAGICAVLEASRKVVTGAKPLRWLSSGPQAERPDGKGTSSVEPTHKTEPPSGPETLVEADSTEDHGEARFGLDAEESTDDLAEFCANANYLASLPVTATGTPEWSACRGAIASLGLSRSYFLELADSGLERKTEVALAFKQATEDYRHARDKMATANLKLVFSISKKYMYSGQPLDDLLQEGNLGLLKAVDRFDWRRGFKFSTYATWWIRQQVGRFVADKGRTIRIPVHVYEKTQRVVRVARDFEFRNHRAPTLEDIAALIDLPIRQVETLAQMCEEPLPLHELPDVDGMISIHAREQFVVCDPIERVEKLELRKSVDDFLSSLKRKEENILRMRYGIGVPDTLTLEEVGAQLGVTRERIRQIEVTAMRRLKHPARLAKFMTELGIEPAPNAGQSAEESSEANTDADGGAPAETGRPASPKTRLEVPTAPRTEARLRVEPTALNKLLNEARDAGIVVEDYLEGEARRLWIHITTTPDNRSRRLVRKLIAHGFEFWPGKGYWR